MLTESNGYDLHSRAVPNNSFDALIGTDTTNNFGANNGSDHDGPDGWIDRERDRLARRLSARLLASPTATSALLAWCEEHGLSSGPISIVRASAQPAFLDDDSLDQLGPEPGEPIAYRRVTLVRGSLALSTADIWFMPHRLLPNMAWTLENSDTPFGSVIAPMRPARRTFFLEFYSPVAGGPEDMALFGHRAVVLGGEPRQALAVVHERYNAGLVEG